MPQIKKTYSHSLGCDEAARRIKAAIEQEKVNKANIVTATREDWSSPYHVDYAMKAFGYDVSGTLDIHDDDVVVVLDLPMIAMMVKGMIEDQLEQELAKLLAS